MIILPLLPIYLLQILVKISNISITCLIYKVVIAVEKYYDIQGNPELCDSVRGILIEYFRAKNIPGQVTFRVADELPWLLLKTEQLDELRRVINTMCIFVRLYRK